jgi:hypothetical protein
MVYEISKNPLKGDNMEVAHEVLSFYSASFLLTFFELQDVIFRVSWGTGIMLKVRTIS